MDHSGGRQPGAAMVGGSLTVYSTLYCVSHNCTQRGTRIIPDTVIKTNTYIISYVCTSTSTFNSMYYLLQYDA